MEVIFGVFFPYASQPIRLEILLLLPSKYIIGHLLPPLLVLDTVTSCFGYYHSLLTSLPPWLLALYSKHNSQSDIFKWGFRSCHFLNTCVDIHFSQNEDYNFKLSIMSYTIWLHFYLFDLLSYYSQLVFYYNHIDFLKSTRDIPKVFALALPSAWDILPPEKRFLAFLKFLFV